MLGEIGREPTNDVLELAKKLGINLFPSGMDPISSKKNKSTNNIIEREESPLKDFPDQTNYENVMNQIVTSLEEKEEYEEALPLLKDLLDFNRKKVNISAMDPLYDRIEKAYSSMKRDEELVTAYKEHLAIKQNLGDLEGEINLLDLISYYYANTSDQEASQRYQAESRRIRSILDKKIEDERD